MQMPTSFEHTKNLPTTFDKNPLKYDQKIYICIYKCREPGAYAYLKMTPQRARRTSSKLAACVLGAVGNGTGTSARTESAPEQFNILNALELQDPDDAGTGTSQQPSSVPSAPDDTIRWYGVMSVTESS